MKKLMICLLASALGASAAAALPLQELERTVFNQVSEQAEKSTPMPKLSEEQIKDLNDKLPTVKQVMEKDIIYVFNEATLVHEAHTLPELNPAELGYALAFSLEREMCFSKEEKTGDPQAVLNDDEKRAIYYALNTLLPPYYLNQETSPADGGDVSTRIPTFTEYNKAFPAVKDWGAFRAAVKDAQELVYKGVVAIATKQANYRHNWLYVLTH